MNLSDVNIRELLKSGELKITPLKLGQIGPASIDLTLDDEFWVFKEKYLKSDNVDLKKVSFNEATKKIRAESVTLKSQEMVLGITRETITMPENLVGRLEGRSRFARMGLAVHVTSSVVQPGSNNRQVLEIVNMAPFTVTIHAGMRISQLVLQHLESPTRKPYSKFGEIATRQ